MGKLPPFLRSDFKPGHHNQNTRGLDAIMEKIMCDSSEMSVDVDMEEEYRVTEIRTHRYNVTMERQEILEEMSEDDIAKIRNYFSDVTGIYTRWQRTGMQQPWMEHVITRISLLATAQAPAYREEANSDFNRFLTNSDFWIENFFNEDSNQVFACCSDCYENMLYDSDVDILFDDEFKSDLIRIFDSFRRVNSLMAGYLSDYADQNYHEYDMEEIDSRHIDEEFYSTHDMHIMSNGSLGFDVRSVTDSLR